MWELTNEWDMIGIENVGSAGWREVIKDKLEISNFITRDEMGKDGLKKRLIRDPSGAVVADHAWILLQKIQNFRAALPT